MIPNGITPLFVDFKASGLHRDSFPIEIGWAVPDGPFEAHLIRPLDGWLSMPWSRDAESLHGIALATIREIGKPPAAILDLLLRATTGSRLYSDDVTHDERWLGHLVTAAGIATKPPRLTLSCANILFQDIAADRGINLAYRLRIARQKVPIRHRAGDDARYLATAYLQLMR